MCLYLDRKQVVCKCWLPVYSGPAFQYCMEPLHRCLPCPWRRQRALLVSMGTLFNVSLSAYQNCTKRGREGERQAEQKEPERGSSRRNQTMPSPQGPSVMQLSPPFDTLTKEGQTQSPAKTGLFFDYIPFYRQEDKTPPQSFLMSFQSHFVTVLLFPLCSPAHSDNSNQPSILSAFLS